MGKIRVDSEKSINSFTIKKDSYLIIPRKIRPGISGFSFVLW